MLSQASRESGLPPGLMELKSDDQEVHDEPCYLSSSPRATRQAFHYGGIANSRQHYTDLPESLSKRYASQSKLKVKSVQKLTLLFLCLRS